MPSREPTPTNGVIRIPLGHVFPSSARLKNLNNALEYQPIISGGRPPLGFLGRWAINGSIFAHCSSVR